MFAICPACGDAEVLQEGNKLNKIAVTKKQGEILSIYPKIAGQAVWVLTNLSGARAETTVLLETEY